MKKGSLMLLLGLLALLNSSVQLRAQASCFLTDWDIVMGGSYFDIFLTQGECEYEVDTGGGSPPNVLALNIQDNFEAAAAHEIRFVLKADQLNNRKKGRFTFLTLGSKHEAEPMFSLDLFWSGARQSPNVLVLEGKISPAIKGSPWATQSLRPGQGPVAIQNGFDGAIEVIVRFFESSGVGADDGALEIWIDGNLEAAWNHLSLDWEFDNAPVSVSYGVVHVLEGQTSGVLRFIPLSPSPLFPTF